MEPEKPLDEDVQTEPIETHPTLPLQSREVPINFPWPFEWDWDTRHISRRLDQFRSDWKENEARMKEERDGGPETLPRTET